MFDSFVQYQKLVQERFRRLQKSHGFTIVDGEQPVAAVTAELQGYIESMLRGARGLQGGATA
jgi:thymidylate kinase